MHYQATCMMLLVFIIMNTAAEWISGTGSVIDCMHGGSLPDQVVNMYCWISVSHFFA